MTEITSKNYDIIIVGGGAAGLTAAIYTSRKMLSTLLVTPEVGGQAALTNWVENYPGVTETDGFLIMQNFKKQAEKFGTQFYTSKITKINKINSGFELVCENAVSLTSRAVILAFGLQHRLLNIGGEKKYTGRGVAYCATCDGPLYKNKTVAVVGGGNSALGAAEYLSSLTNKVYLLNRNANFSGDDFIVNRIKKISNIEIMHNTAVMEIKGDIIVKSLLIKIKDDEQEIPIDGIFIEIGYQAKTDWLKGLIELNDRGEILINQNNQTNVEGIFAAGDATSVSHKQIVIAAGEGAKAALSAYYYLKNNNNY